MAAFMHQEIFQNISCYCLTANGDADYQDFDDFKTSHVIV